MKKIFWIGLIGLLLFEVANVYFIMPMPGSQRFNSIDLAYFLYRYRWVFRVSFVLLVILGLLRGFQFKKRWLLVPVMLVAAVVYMANFQMAADQMFKQPEQLIMADAGTNKVDTNRLVIGVVHNDVAKAYPIRFLGYHHQVKDTIAGKPILVTYCTVCRTGRVYEPVVNGHPESFRLVGMDHFNAIFEDATTHCWWRQVSGEAITGSLKGQQLPEYFSTQSSLSQWLRLHPQSLIMQEDPAFKDLYDSTLKYETGKSTSSLTGTDSLSWKDKSWVIGVKAGNDRKAFDWNELQKKKIINDKIGTTPMVLVLSNDNRSFFAFTNPDESIPFSFKNDTLQWKNHLFLLNGKGIDTSYSLHPLSSYQEFWHSWRTFNPGTEWDGK